MNILVRERIGSLNMSSLAKKRSKLRRKNNGERERESMSGMKATDILMRTRSFSGDKKGAS